MSLDEAVSGGLRRPVCNRFPLPQADEIMSTSDIDAEPKAPRAKAARKSITKKPAAGQSDG